MTPQEVKEKLKVGDYGEITMVNKVGHRVICTGTIIFITKKGTVTFYDNEKKEYFKNPDQIISFQHKEMLPQPTEHAGRPITYDNGRFIYTESGKEVKMSVRRELEDRNVIYVLRRLNRYFNSLHGYERGLRGLSAEDFSMLVLQKIISGERSWEKSSTKDFMNFCLDVMKSELAHFRASPEYKNVISHDISLENDKRWPRIGLEDKFNGF